MSIIIEDAVLRMYCMSVFVFVFLYSNVLCVCTCVSLFLLHAGVRITSWPGYLACCLFDNVYKHFFCCNNHLHVSLIVYYAFVRVLYALRSNSLCIVNKCVLLLCNIFLFNLYYKNIFSCIFRGLLIEYRM